MESYYNRVMGNNIKYRLREGNRGRGVPESAFADIVADCTQCTQSIGIDFAHTKDHRQVSDKDAVDVFRKQGWCIDLTTKPKIVLCYRCVKGECR